MGWEDLVCAACAGRVVEGRCATCRAARSQFRSTPPSTAPLLLAVAAAVLLALLVALTH